MSELLDVFDDEGLLDSDTRRFLVEALANAEADDWRDILEPFVNPERAMEVLTSVPRVLTRSLEAVEEKPVCDGAVVVDPLPQYFLFALPGGVLAASGVMTSLRCARLCRAARELLMPEQAAGALFWQARAELIVKRWRPWRLSLSQVGSWRARFLQLLRPRFDGIFVGECRFKRYVRVGLYADLRKNAQQLAADGGRGHTADWINYRRYVRLLPPGPNGSLRALMLQDSCPRAAAESVLLEGVDLETHENPAKPDPVLGEGLVESITDPSRLKKRICLADCTYTHEEQRIDIRYSAGGGDFHVTFRLSHGGERKFAACLEWQEYTRTDPSSGEVLTYNLGRLPDWKGGGLADEDKDHFPDMGFQPKLSIEHLLW